MMSTVGVGREKLSAEKMRNKGQTQQSLKKYNGQWRRFHKWLSVEHPNCVVEGKDVLDEDQLYFAVNLPISWEVLDQYLEHIVYDGNGDLKTVSTPDGFWAAMSLAHKKQLPNKLPIPDELRAKWDSFRTGFRKHRANVIVEDGLSVYEGKDSMSRKAYLNLQKLALDPNYCTPEKMVWIPAMNAGTRNLSLEFGSLLSPSHFSVKTKTISLHSLPFWLSFPHPHPLRHFFNHEQCFEPD
jgi:hypothetical protein